MHKIKPQQLIVFLPGPGVHADCFGSFACPNQHLIPLWMTQIVGAHHQAKMPIIQLSGDGPSISSFFDEAIVIDGNDQDPASLAEAKREVMDRIKQSLIYKS